MRPFAGKVTVKIDGYVGSAASVIAMAGDGTLMPPVSYVLIHNPATVAIGDGEEMLRIKERLDKIKEGIINAYEAKTGLPRKRGSQLMDAKSCFNSINIYFAISIMRMYIRPCKW